MKRLHRLAPIRVKSAWAAGLMACLACGCAKLSVTSSPPGAQFRTRMSYDGKEVNFSLPGKTESGTTPAAYSRKWMHEAVKVCWPDGVESNWKIASDVTGMKNLSLHFDKEQDQLKPGSDIATVIYGAPGVERYRVPIQTTNPVLTFAEMETWERMCGIRVNLGSKLVVKGAWIELTNSAPAAVLARLSRTAKPDSLDVEIESAGSVSLFLLPDAYVAEYKTKGESRGARKTEPLVLETGNRYVLAVSGPDAGHHSLENKGRDF